MQRGPSQLKIIFKVTICDNKVIKEEEEENDNKRWGRGEESRERKKLSKKVFLQFVLKRVHHQMSFEYLG